MSESGTVRREERFTALSETVVISTNDAQIGGGLWRRPAIPTELHHLEVVRG